MKPRINPGSVTTWLDESSEFRRERARWLVERMLTGEDPFNVVFWAAGAIPVFIVTEAWTQERKAEIRQYGQQMGYMLVEHAVIGDYDLTLWHTEKIEYPGYVVGINSGQHNPLEREAQVTKQTAGGHISLRMVQRTVAGWLHDYGPLVIGSVVPERNESYLLMLKKLFPEAKFEPFYAGDFRDGFRILA